MNLLWVCMLEHSEIGYITVIDENGYHHQYYAYQKMYKTKNPLKFRSDNNQHQKIIGFYVTVSEYKNFFDYFDEVIKNKTIFNYYYFFLEFKLGWNIWIFKK